MITTLLMIFVILNPLKDINVALRIGPLDWYNLFYLTCIMTWVIKKNIQWVHTPVNKIFIWFIIFFIVSYFRGFLPPFSVDQAENFYRLKDIVTEVFLFFIYLNLITSKKQIRLIIYALVATMTYEAFIVIQQYFEAISIFGADFSWDLKSRITGTFLVGGGGTGSASANEVGSFFALYTLLVGGYAACCPIKKIRFTLFGFCALFILPLLFSQSRGAWIGFIIALVVYTLRNNKKFLIMLIILFFVSIPFLPESVLERAAMVGDKSSESRLDFWTEALSAMTNPIYFISGIGFNKAYIYIGMDTHNSYIRNMLEAGIGGLVVILLLTKRVYSNLNLYLKEVHDPTIRGFILGVLISFTCFIILNCVGTRLYNGQTAATMWAFLGIAFKAYLIDNEDRQNHSIVDNNDLSS